MNNERTINNCETKGINELYFDSVKRQRNQQDKITKNNYKWSD